MNAWRASLLTTLLLLGCPVTDVQPPTPMDRFYFPTAIAHLDNPAAPTGDGLLVVASTNFDKRFSSGSLVAINLDTLATRLPAFGAAPGQSPVQLPALRSPGAVSATSDGGFPDAVAIAAFAGQLAPLELSPGRWRLFVPTRAEFQRVHAAELTVGGDGAVALGCFNSSSRDCSTTATSLTQFEQSTTGIPRAPGAFGVALRLRRCTAAADCGTLEAVTAGLYDCVQARCVAKPADGGLQEPAADALITHIAQADSPLGSGTNLRGFLVTLGTETLALSEQSFIDLGAGATHAVAVGKRWNYVSGRFLNPSGNLIRLVDTGARSFVSSGVEAAFRVGEARGIALSADERRVYLLGRFPDALLVATVDDAASSSPTLTVVRGVPLPEAPNELAVISRPGRGDLVVITCTNAGVVAFYDDDLGDLVAQVPGVGLQPFGLAVDRRGPGVRLFTSNFQDGRVAVIEVPDVNDPQDARLVAHLGAQQLCLIRPSDPSCLDGGSR